LAENNWLENGTEKKIQMMTDFGNKKKTYM
jgi:hypothetical protein